MKDKNTLLSIFGAKLSKDGKRVVITLVNGEDDDKNFYTACVKLDNSQKTKAKIVESLGKKYALVQINFIKDASPIDEEDLPFAE